MASTPGPWGRLVFGWMNGRPERELRPKMKHGVSFVDGWHAIAASSRHGLGLFVAGAPLNLFRSLSCGSDFSQRVPSNEQRPRCLQDGRGNFYSKLHCVGLLRVPLADKGGSSPHWSLGVLMSGPWRLWALSLGSPINGGRKRFIANGVGGEHGGGSSDRPDNQGYPSRTVTSIILGLNILLFLGQIATKGRVLLLGAKVNSLINQGQLWRLLTPSLLHANLFHLLVNSYSLNSIGPTVESLAGTKRFLAVYSASALASTTLSYFCCAAPSVGASGAIFGLVGALAVFLVRHKNMMVGGRQSLQQVGQVIAINLVLGLATNGIDNWSHLGGLLGGAAVTWLVGPVYTFEIPPGGGQRQLVDRPPISHLFSVKIKRKR